MVAEANIKSAWFEGRQRCPAVSRRGYFWYFDIFASYSSKPGSHVLKHVSNGLAENMDS